MEEYEQASKRPGSLVLTVILLAIIGYAGYRIYPPMVDLWTRAHEAEQEQRAAHPRRGSRYSRGSPRRHPTRRMRKRMPVRRPRGFRARAECGACARGKCDRGALPGRLRLRRREKMPCRLSYRNRSARKKRPANPREAQKAGAAAQRLPRLLSNQICGRDWQACRSPTK